MAPAPSPTTRSRRQARLARATPRWRRWLLIGLFFGIGHGLTQRLMEVRWGEDSNRPPAFRAKAPSGGTSLEELRRQHGQQAKPLTADLETLARAKREEKEKQATAKKEEEARQKAALQREKDRVESEQRRMEAFDSPTEPPMSEPLGREESVPTTPPTPELPPPEPFAVEPPASAPAAGAPSQP